ncbi:LysM peptidoglycan-binding domain-containing protein [Metabacillus fastidiosus]|uniref:LysM peptidoglycan-binding domain-containing protein n=1 Tax=Metabacillus fastidiosus TaxID=1458 RepID=UPI002E1BFAB0|nr:LysM peptidoglycan-binding domain-containing protein [Metabacillus fastidiosus]
MIEFWLSYNEVHRIRFPVNPPSLSVGSPFGHTDIKIVNLGEFTVIGDRELKEFEFSSFFPKHYNPTYCEYSGFREPRYLLNLIEKWRNTRKPLRFIVTGTPINYAVTIREFSYDVEKAGHMGDIYFSLTLKEFKPLKLRQEIDVTKKKTTGSDRPPVVNKGQLEKKVVSYTIKVNDTLQKIAARKDVYGNASDWRKIYEANKKVIGANPNLIKQGTKLVIPR